MTFGILFSRSLFEGTDTIDKESFFVSNPNGSDNDMHRIPFQSKSSTIQNADILPRYPVSFEQTVELFVQIAQADTHSLQQLLDQTTQVPIVVHRHFLQNLIFRRFASVDVDGALEQTLQLPLSDRSSALSGIFEEWSLSDLEAAITGAERLTGLAKRLATKTIMKVRDDLPEIRRLEIAKRLGYDEVGVQLLEEESFAVAIENPEAFWYKILNQGQGDLSQDELLARIAANWIEQDGFETVSQIVSSFSNVFEGDLNALSSILQEVAQSEPIAVLNVLNEISSKFKRETLQSGIVFSWAHDDPKSVLANIDHVPVNLQWLAKHNAMVKIAQTSPEEAILLLDEATNELTREAVGFSLVSEWAEQDVMAAMEWVLSESSIEDLRSDMVRILLPRLAHIDPQRALEMALEQPTTLHYVAPVAEVITALVQTNADDAIGMLSHVGEQAKLSTYKSVASELIRNQDVDRAFELASQLSESDQRTYLKYVVRQWAIDSPLDVIKNLGQLPTKRVTSHAALMLLAFDYRAGSLSRDQVDYVKTFLSDGDHLELRKYERGEKFLGNYEEH